ncbi:MAG: VWA domain-containing protein, partial [Elusimicrobia bacterium]|nr:VWA domain-containing protein [Elusimicrobiota bacterium]
MTELFRYPMMLPILLLTILALIALLAWSSRRKQRILAQLGHPSTLYRMIPMETPKRQNLKKNLRLAAVLSLLLAVAGPQWGIELTEFESASNQIVIAVDTSLSMNAEDIKPNRMHRAKEALSLLMDQLKGNRIGLIAFSGEAHIQCPLTSDMEAVKTFLSSLQAGMLPQPGTAIGKAIRLASKMLKPYTGEKALILLTDGEDHHSNPLQAAQEAQQTGIHIFPIGLGTPQGDPIPIRDETGKISGYKKNKKGE